MRMPAILKRWIETLATLLVAWHEHRREQRALTIALENQQVVVRETRSSHDITRPQDRPEPNSSAHLLDAPHNSFVVAEFPPDKIVRRDITVPAGAQKFLSGVVRNQIERLSPWPPNDVVYGFDGEVNSENASVFDVRILIASRANIDAFRKHLATLNVQVDRIVANSLIENLDDARKPVTLWSRSTDGSLDHPERLSRLIGLGIGGIVAASTCLTLWAFVSAGNIRDESESIAVRAKALQLQIQGGQMPSAAASGSSAERAWFLKETSGSSVILLEALSRALPDSAYLTEIRLESATLRMVGLADDAPGLLAPLEQSGHLTGVHFSAPTTRGSDGKSFRFSIEAHVEPRIRLEKE
ncbi:PilN domain-containing protein [Bradyrhizobium erythrophlei]|uniref:General secretion pathway protein L n=1 Tax=Bradyrhizobium erythrophlei TaxID=1437360 RepID=A0A1M7UXZ8_9BRAD|nr:PilN domain-containing protein [Bradyrhizobium erythrophlei]SHN87839.1 general secretion pathway protein L [Bradyrhizobium erythrophlei]